MNPHSRPVPEAGQDPYGVDADSWLNRDAGVSGWLEAHGMGEGDRRDRGAARRAARLPAGLPGLRGRDDDGSRHDPGP